MPDHQYVLTLSCPDRPGIVAAVSTFLVQHGQNILDAQQFDDAETGKFFMRVVFDRRPIRRTLSALQTGFARDRRAASAMDWPLRDRASEAQGDAPGLASSTTAWSTCSIAGASASCRWILAAIVSNHPRETYAAHRFRRHPLPPPAGHQGDQAASRRRRSWRSDRGDRHRSRRARPLHADPVGRPGRQAVGPLHQHPPLVPAGLQGREALSPGARARREADRRDGPLRHRATSTRGRSSSRTSSASATATRPRTWSARAATSSAACWPAPIR